VQVGSYLNGIDTRPDTMALYLYLTSGPNDDSLKWPCPWHQATMSLMDQQSDVRTRMNMQRMVTTDPNQMDGKPVGHALGGRCWNKSTLFAVLCGKRLCH
jgi:hypothetical protein